MGTLKIVNTQPDFNMGTLKIVNTQPDFNMGTLKKISQYSIGCRKKQQHCVWIYCEEVVSCFRTRDIINTCFGATQECVSMVCQFEHSLQTKDNFLQTKDNFSKLKLVNLNINTFTSANTMMSIVPRTPKLSMCSTNCHRCTNSVGVYRDQH